MAVSDLLEMTGRTFLFIFYHRRLGPLVKSCSCLLCVIIFPLLLKTLSPAPVVCWMNIFPAPKMRARPKISREFIQPKTNACGWRTFSFRVPLLRCGFHLAGQSSSDGLSVISYSGTRTFPTPATASALWEFEHPHRAMYTENATTSWAPRSTAV